jgi:hypothetical protein
MQRRERKHASKLTTWEQTCLLGSRKPMKLNTDGWSKQLERWGIKTNGYRLQKKREYALRRNAIVGARKFRELEKAASNCPEGRLNHLAKQIGRLEDVRSPKPDWMQPGGSHVQDR